MKSYAPHDPLAAPALRTKSLFLTLVGFIAIEFMYQLGRDLLDYLLVNLAPGVAPVIFDGIAPIAVLYDLFGFAVLGLLVVFVARRNHDRGLRTLVGPFGLAKEDFRRSVLAAGVMHLMLLAIVPWGLDQAEMIPLSHWMRVAPVAIVALLVQTGAEELFYRGYLQQQLAARFRNPLIWMVLPNVAFAWVHWSNGADFTDSVYYVGWAFIFGLAASDLTARSGSLGAAIGFHLMNNVFAFMVADVAGFPGSGLALFLFPGDPLPLPLSPDDGAALVPDLTDSWLIWQMAVDLAVIGVTWLAVRVAIRR